MALDQPTDKTGFWPLLSQIYAQHGLAVVLLVLFLGFACLLMWSLIWKVWSSAMKAKDDEIARISKERDTYRAIVLDRLPQVVIVETEDKKRLAAVRRDHGNT